VHTRLPKADEAVTDPPPPYPSADG